MSGSKANTTKKPPKLEVKRFTIKTFGVSSSLRTGACGACTFLTNIFNGCTGDSHSLPPTHCNHTKSGLISG